MAGCKSSFKGCNQVENFTYKVQSVPTNYSGTHTGSAHISKI